MAERAIQTIKNTMKKCFSSKRDLNLALSEIRNCPISNNVSSPAEKFFGRKTRGILPILCILVAVIEGKTKVPEI